jgi:hypothetical protein
MNCSSVITLPQKSTSSTCWFNSIMMALFYSQGMRSILLKRLNNNTSALARDGRSTVVKNIIHEILHKHYIKNDEYIKFYNTFSPEFILKELNKENPEYFDLDIEDDESHKGYFAWRYIHKMIEYLDIKNYAYIDAILKDVNTDKYGLYFKPFVFEEIGKKYDEDDEYDEEAEHADIKKYFSINPDVLLINTQSSINSDDYPEYFFKQHIFLNEEITYNGQEYVVDSMLLDNFNSRVCKIGHTICGITCHGNRYMYNGWTSLSFDKTEKGITLQKKPCGLMKHDWLDKKLEQFCIDRDNCDLKYLETKVDKIKALKELCFSYKKGPRIYIYIRKDFLNQEGGSGKYKHNGKSYKIRIGPRGGKYIISNGVKIRIPK